MYCKLEFKDADAVAGIADISHCLTTLDLSDNRLGRTEPAKLTRAIAAIPENVTTLDLSNNELCYLAPAELPGVFAAIKESVTTLNLGGNQLFSAAANLPKALAALPKSLTNLNLRNNGFGLMYDILFGETLAAIPRSVTSLNLCNNNLFNRSIDALSVLRNALTHIQVLYLSKKELDQMSQEQRNTLRGAFPNQDIFIVDEDNNVLGGNSPQARAYFAERHYGLSGKAPTLQAFAGFFVSQMPKKIVAKKIKALPPGLTEHVQQFELRH